MVFVFDEGAVYDAPIDKIWKLNMAHGSSMAKIHPGAKDPKFEQLSDTVFQASYGTDIGGQTIQIAVKFTFFPPLGFAAEHLEGPFEGTKFFNYYTPKGDQTEVTVAGEFVSKAPMSDDQVKEGVLALLEEFFEQDKAFLATM
uniref:Uncharacterized protein n=1 Tax=uncultured marine microorganism HF4000_ANIW141A21 TaxID=455535 RepID=B3T573_9ZZZZ|nr:hypothetical protein ALOHA_HF4000ANIW141A21ctg1g16 [uncultured marine microorganism HF4000_ANIW141A21]